MRLPARRRKPWQRKEPFLSVLIPISKRKLGLIRALHAKKERVASGWTLLEGERLVSEALRDRVRFQCAVGTSEFWLRRKDFWRQLGAAGVPAFSASVLQMGQLAVTEHSCGILAVVACPRWQEEEVWRRYPGRGFLGLLAAGLQDPGNLGTLIRSLAAADGHAAWLTSRSVEVSGPRVLRASAGSVFRMPVLEGADALEVMTRCHREGIQLLAAVPREGRPHTTMDLTQPTLLLLGAEGGGLDKTLLEAVDQVVHIPMPGAVESLNVAAAGAVIFFEAVRQRRVQNARTEQRLAGRETRA